VGGAARRWKPPAMGRGGQPVGMWRRRGSAELVTVDLAAAAEAEEDGDVSSGSGSGDGSC
jgi:hypothetical protein